MKKVSLKDVKNALRRDEMRAIKGGCLFGNCCAQTKTGPYCGLSMDHAQHVAAANGGHWCCSGCGGATWL